MECPASVIVSKIVGGHNGRICQFSAMKNMVAIIAGTEGLAGIAAMLVPAAVIDLVFGAEASAQMIILCQAFGAALVGIAFACWPRNSEPELLHSQCQALASYSGLVTLILISAALSEQRSILWGMAILHAALTMLLAFQRTPIRRPAIFTL